jgi:hypothetical protein
VYAVTTKVRQMADAESNARRVKRAPRDPPVLPVEVYR